MEEERIDKIIMERKLVSSRVRAEELISKFGVLVNGKLISKPGKKVPVDAEIELISEEIPWVSKGALKLVAAIDEWSFNCTDKYSSIWVQVLVDLQKCFYQKERKKYLE